MPSYYERLHSLEKTEPANTCEGVHGSIGRAAKHSRTPIFHQQGSEWRDSGDRATSTKTPAQWRTPAREIRHRTGDAPCEIVETGCVL